MKARYLVLIVAAAVLGGCSSDEGDQPPVQAAPASRLAGARVPAGLSVPPFSLRDQDGGAVTRASLAGGPTVVIFLTTRCGSTCLLVTSQVKGALDDLGGPATAVAISTDPAHDTAPAARRLVRRVGMSGRLRFLLGSRSELRPVWRGFGIDPRGQRDPHDARLVLLDPSAKQRVGFPLEQATPERLAHDLRILGAE